MGREHLNYTAVVTVAGRATGERIEQVTDHLQDHQATVGRSQAGHIDVTLHLPARGLHEAVAAALTVVERAAGTRALSVEVLPEADFNGRQVLSELPALVSVTEAADMLGITRQAVLKMIDTGRIPAQQAGNTWVMPQAAVEQLL